MHILFIISGLLYIYPFIIYPLILKIIAHFVKRIPKKDYNFEPELAILIACYNEEKYIRETIDSILNSDYPTDKMKIYIGSDGSNDRTVKILENMKDNGYNINIYDLPRQGKNKTINYLMDLPKEEFLLSIDADLRLNKDTIRELISNFADESVGSVIGNLVEQTDNLHLEYGFIGESFYQKYESNLRKAESAIASTVNGIGVYCVRKKIIEKLPNNKVCDDYYPLLTSIKKNKRAIFNPNAKFISVREQNINYDFNRHVRTMVGGLCTVLAAKELLNPYYGFNSFFLWSHKIFRLNAPFFLIIMNIIAAIDYHNSNLYFIFFQIEIFLFFMGIISWSLIKVNFNNKLVKILYYILSMNLVYFAGIKELLMDKDTALWETSTKIKK